MSNGARRAYYTSPLAFGLFNLIMRRSDHPTCKVPGIVAAINICSMPGTLADEREQLLRNEGDSITAETTESCSDLAPPSRHVGQ